MPILLRTAKGEISGTQCKVRVINVASNGHELAAPKKGIVWETLLKGDASLKARKSVGSRLYGQSKLVNLVFFSCIIPL
jgi:retinol dehydrogenase 12